MRRLLPLILALLAWALQSSGEQNEKNYAVRMYGIAESFEWREHFMGEQIVKEDGSIFGLGGELDLLISNPLWFTARAELYGGEADYEGYIMGENDRTPYNSNTEYVGLRMESELGYKISAGSGNSIKPYAGLGIRSWERTLDTEFSDRHIGRYGYTEYWSTLYAIAGIKLSIPVNPNSELFALCAAHLPIENWLTVDMDNVGGPDDIELDPGKETTYRAELGYNAYPITISIYYETMEFSQSDYDSSGTYLQPESEAKMIGAQIGLIF